MVKNPQSAASKVAYAWVLDQLKGEEVPYGAFVEGLPLGHQIAVDPRVDLNHAPLHLRYEGYDLNDQPDREDLVRKWGRALRREAEGWSDPDRKKPDPSEKVRLKVLSLADDTEFEVTGLLHGQEWINAGNGAHLHGAHFRVLGWRRD